MDYIGIHPKDLAFYSQKPKSRKDGDHLDYRVTALSETPKACREIRVNFIK